MAYIYKITNKINGKIYIGKTERTVEERWNEHCNDFAKDRCKDRPLYRAMNKYGVENFHIEAIEETSSPEERECFWIEHFQSFKKGYNATIGGDGKRYLDYDLVIATYKEVQNQAEVARLLGIDVGSVRSILRSNNIESVSCGLASAIATGKIVNQYDLQGNYIQSFISAKAAAESLNKITPTSKGASSHISDVCRGKRKTAYGYIWKFSN